MNGSQRYTFEQLREQINNELLSEHMPERLYKSTDGIMRVINAIVKTNGENWAVQVLNNEGNPLLSKQEQTQFTDAFEPYIGSIIDFFGDESTDDIIQGGAYSPDISKLSGMSSNFLKTKAAQATHSFPIPQFDPEKLPGVDVVYNKVINRIGNVNSVVNDYASKYGVLKLEKEHDLEEDIRLVPKPAAVAISEGLFTLSTAAGLPILPNITLEILSKLKVPFRVIVFTVYLILDISRIAVGISGPSISRKILSVLLSIAELLKGDWKKAVLTMLGYYGMMPMLIGELLKVFLTMFRMLAPQIQNSIIFGSFDAAKSLVIGLLLAIFQVTAPEQVRLPLIGILEKIAQRKAEMDGTLEDIGLSARPDYLAPTWNDLNNIQAVMSDEGYICSCEFEELVKAVNNSAIIRLVLQLLRIPVTKDMIEYKCGKGACKDFVTTVVKEAKNDTDKEERVKTPFSESDFQLPADLNPLTSITAPVDKAISDTKEALSTATNNLSSAVANTATKAATSALTGALTSSLKGITPKTEIKEEEAKKEEVAEKKEDETQKEEIPQPKLTVKGGRILHSRKRKLRIT
jgi:hypothetical protein